MHCSSSVINPVVFGKAFWQKLAPSRTLGRFSSWHLISLAVTPSSEQSLHRDQDPYFSRRPMHYLSTTSFFPMVLSLPVLLSCLQKAQSCLQILSGSGLGALSGSMQLWQMRGFSPRFEPLPKMAGLLKTSAAVSSSLFLAPKGSCADLAKKAETKSYHAHYCTKPKL